MRRSCCTPVNSAILNGQPNLRGTRLRANRVVMAVALCPNSEQLFQYPELDAEDIRQKLDFTACNFDESVLRHEETL